MLTIEHIVVNNYFLEYVVQSLLNKQLTVFVFMCPHHRLGCEYCIVCVEFEGERSLWHKEHTSHSSNKRTLVKRACSLEVTL